MKQIFSIAKLTLVSSIRFKVFISLVLLLCLVVLFLPLVIQSDGTIKGQIQIVLEYTLGLIGFILSLSTIWLMCASLSNEYQLKTVYMLTTKPISRFKILIGKIMGVMIINFLALSISSAFILAHIWFISSDKNMKKSDRRILEDEVLVAREVVGKNTNNVMVSPGKTAEWTFHNVQTDESGIPVFVKFRFFLSDISNMKALIQFASAKWYVGDVQVADEERYHPGSFYELQFPYALVKNGSFVLTFLNASSRAVTFPKGNVEILIKRDTFILNYIRVLLIDMFLFTLLSIIAVVASVFMTFQVATFFSLSFYLAASMVTFLKTIVTRAIIFSTGCSDHAHHHEHDHATWLDEMMRFFLKGIILIFPDLKSFDFIDHLVLGKIVPWISVGHAFVILIVFYGGVIFLIGSVIFARKEVALIEE